MRKIAQLQARAWNQRIGVVVSSIRAGLIDDRALLQLSSIRNKHNPRGQVVIESKDGQGKRGIKTPNRAESIMSAFADRTPGILCYYEGLNRKTAVVESGGWNNPNLPDLHGSTAIRNRAILCVLEPGQRKKRVLGLGGKLTAQPGR